MNDEWDECPSILIYRRWENEGFVNILYLSLPFRLAYGTFFFVCAYAFMWTYLRLQVLNRCNLPCRVRFVSYTGVSFLINQSIKIYIAPLQDPYSEVLLTQAKRKRTVLSRWWNSSWHRVWHNIVNSSSKDSWFSRNWKVNWIFIGWLTIRASDSHFDVTLCALLIRFVLY